GEHGAGKRCLPRHGAAGGDDGQRPGGRDPQGVQGLADEELAQHRADGGPAVPTAGERRGARALEVDVAEAAAGIGALAQEEGAVSRPSPSGVDSRSGSRPSSAASGSLRTSNRGSGTSAARHGTASSGSSRAKLWPSRGSGGAWVIIPSTIRRTCPRPPSDL